MPRFCFLFFFFLSSLGETYFFKFFSVLRRLKQDKPLTYEFFVFVDYIIKIKIGEI